MRGANTQIVSQRRKANKASCGTSTWRKLNQRKMPIPAPGRWLTNSFSSGTAGDQIPCRRSAADFAARSARAVDSALLFFWPRTPESSAGRRAPGSVHASNLQSSGAPTKHASQTSPSISSACWSIGTIRLFEHWVFMARSAVRSVVPFVQIQRGSSRERACIIKAAFVTDPS